MNLNIGGNKKSIRALVILLELLVIGLIIYLIALPFYPSLKYELDSKNTENVDYKDFDEIKKITESLAGFTEEIELEKDNINNVGNENKENKTISTSTEKVEINKENKTAPAPVKKEELKIEKKKNIPNTLLIPKIGVNIPIIESEDENYGLDRGAWKVPKSSTPEEIGNLILTGHRFKYLPPSNLTFYLFHKLEAGDIASIIWNNKIYYYKIKESKIVPGDDLSILKQTKTHTLTMYTCDPIYSTKNRLVIVAELVKE